MNYLKNKEDRVNSDSSFKTISTDILTMSLLDLAADVSKFEFAPFALTDGTLSYDLLDPTSLKNFLDEIKTHLKLGIHLPKTRSGKLVFIIH